MDYVLLGKQIRKQRLALGLTQEQLAEAIGVSTSYVGHIERGTRKASIDTLVEISNAMNVSADFLKEDLAIPTIKGKKTDKENIINSFDRWNNNTIKS